jgi:hypothetical protein
MNITYTIKAGDSTSSIAAKFGKSGRENELIALNTQIPKRTVYHMGRPQVVFADLLIGQKIRIPSSWVNRTGAVGVGKTVQCPSGYVYNAKMGVCMPQSVGVGKTVQCPSGYVYNAKMGVCMPQSIGVGKTVRCPKGYVYNAKMGVCVPRGVGVGEVGDFCVTDDMCGYGETCSWGTCEKIQGTTPAEDYINPENYDYSEPDSSEPACNVLNSGCNTDSDCCSGYCNTNVKVIPGSEGQCQIKGVTPPGLKLLNRDGESCVNNWDCESNRCQNGICVKQVAGCKSDGLVCNINSDCCSGICKNGMCTPPSVTYQCTDPDIIEQVYTNLGTLYPAISGYGNYGEWNEALQAALEDSGMTFQEAYAMGNPAAPTCSGGEPSPVYCSEGQDFNLDTGKCEVIGGTTPVKKPPSCATGYQLNAQGTACVKINNNDITPVVDKDEVEKEKEGGFPWGWAALGAVVVIGGGTAIYYATKKSNKSSSPVTKKPVIVSERMRRHY